MTPVRQRPGERFCLWCDRAFLARVSGGKPQRFCGDPCRAAFHAAAHRWATAAIAAGRLSVQALRRGFAAGPGAVAAPRAPFAGRGDGGGEGGGGTSAMTARRRPAVNVHVASMAQAAPRPLEG